jgi:hypothetical protein
MTLVIKTAEELIDPALEARWATRRAARQTEVLQWILRAFIARGGPIPTEAITAAFRLAHPRPSGKPSSPWTRKTWCRSGMGRWT